MQKRIPDQRNKKRTECRKSSCVGCCSCISVISRSSQNAVWFLTSCSKSYYSAIHSETCLTDFQNVRKQLNQDVLPVWSDEGVFAIVCDIFLHEKDTFGDLYPCMGPFHWCRVLLKCQGKLLRGTGIDDALVECEVFGPIVLDTALNGHHYARALTGMLIVEDVMMRLLWKAFWNIKEKHDYPVIEEIEKLQTSLNEDERNPQLFNTILQKIEKLHRDFKSIKQEAEEKSELCRYIGQWLKIVALIKNAVAAERKGNWNLLISVVENTMAVFAELDCGNYLRYGSW